MQIEILGAGLKNKGAHLMLTAIVKKLSSSFPETRFAVRSKKGKNWDPGELGLFQKPALSENPIGDLVFKITYGRRKRESCHMILDSEIDVVLDASGFKYSDQFGALGTWRRAKRIARWKRSGKKIILLPQAFGPFEIPKVREAIKIIADHVDLMCPRDQDSLDFVHQLVGPRESIRMFPDFTNIVPGKVPEYFSTGKPRACLVPNTQMLVKTSGPIREFYIPFFARSAKYLKEADLDPFILLHDVPRDRSLAEDIRKASGASLEIIEDGNPLHLKGIIGSCHLLVGSRLHALISALSQGVPAVATGWSHKYERLFQDYGCPELLISNLDFEAEAQGKLKLLTDGKYRDRIVSTLRESSRVEMQKTEQMWRDVTGIISG